MSNALKTQEEMGQIYSDALSKSIRLNKRSLISHIIAEVVGSKDGFVQHYATPERQLKRREMAYIGKRQYKKLKFAVELRKSYQDYKAPHNGPDGDPYTYITYPVEGADPFLSELHKSDV